MPDPSLLAYFCRSVAMTLLLCLFASPSAAQQPETADTTSFTRQDLFTPSRGLPVQIKQAPEGLKIAQPAGTGWSISGRVSGAATVMLQPAGGRWDLSTHSLFQLRLRNAGPGTVRVDGRLNNPGAVDWANSARSHVYLKPGETGTLTIAFPRRWEQDDSPDAFEPASAKGNGWRSHWKPFNPADVRSCRLTIRSSETRVRLKSIAAQLAWPYGKEANEPLLALPHIDRFGQAIPFTWPEKVDSIDDLRQHRLDEAEALSEQQGPEAFNAFGGYANGPELEATGFFRTQKVDGRWWLVDPSGSLFWSQGVCTVGNRTIAPLSPERRKLFAYLPEPGSQEHKAAVVAYKPYGEWGRAVDFLRLNTMRKYGEGWQEQADDVTHLRLRAWGFNTLGAWSDTALMDDRLTPFTEILHIWPGQTALDNTADPFEAGFEQRVHDAAAKLAKTRKNDPWMIGVFIDNEIVWHNNYPERVLDRGPMQPAYQAFVDHLRAKYRSIRTLNEAWGTEATGWKTLKPGTGEAWKRDRTELFALVAGRYYGICKAAVDKHLPNHLYLGSRVHTCPPVVAEQIAKHVDVFSINHYAPLAGTAQLPKDADLPVMITEYHFGTLDRGVVGMSLSPVHDQTQRARSFGAYTMAGLLHPNIVGAHWFAYSDHSTVGRPNENYQIGLIDITDQPYTEMTEMARRLGERMYASRLEPAEDVMEAIHRLLVDH
ncbi:MAG: beta-galactosidase [Planctomycetota bacterium]